MYYLKQRTVFINLVVMAYMWCAVSFCYYMVSFQLKYLPGNIYNNGMASSGSELLAYALSGVVYKFLKIRLSFVFSFSVGLFGGLLILFLGKKDESWMPIFVIFAKFGISMGFALVYIATEQLFPTLFCATAFGICNLFSRGLSIGAP